MKLRECLASYTVDFLRPLAALCGCQGVTRKAQFIDGIVAVMTSPEGLRQQWEQLDELSKAAVAHAVHDGGELDKAAFRARYGRMPERSKGRWSWRQKPIRLDLFLYNGRIPDDLLPLLESWVPRPEPFRVQGLSKAPETLKYGKFTLELLRADTELTGQQDLTAFLRLVEDGQVRVTSATRLPTAGTVKKLLPLLAEGDFFPIDDEKKIKVADTIRPVGLTHFALYSALAQFAYRNNKVELTEAGREWLHTQDPELLLDAFETWTHSDGFDELSRIQALRGQRSRKTRLTPPSSRRERVIEALSWCPVGVWIDIEDFFRAIRIWQLDFEVESTSYTNLHIGPSAEYGWLGGYEDSTYWRLVQGPYILAVLWEDLASIGALDILYLPPEEADYRIDIFYFDEPYLSRYDGLKYFRINKLGAYLFGQEAEYTPYVQTRPPFLHVTEDLLVRIVAPQAASQADRMLLSTFATPVDEQSYRLDLDSLLTALAEGRDLDAALGFLTQWHEGPLPDAVMHLFADAKARGRAFATPKKALTIQARTAELAQMASQDPKLRRFCKLLGDRMLVIPANREHAFRSRLRELGYVVPES